jgi:hypothetical protein
MRLLPPKTRSLSAVGAVAMLATFGAACLDRALPGSGRLAGAAGASGVVSGAGGAAGVTSGGPGSGGATAAGAGGGGGAALGCPRIACPENICPGAWATDERGCQTCTCAPVSDCMDASCGPRPFPPSGCPQAVIACVSNGDQCVWSFECPLPPCPTADCGPSPGDLPVSCNDRASRSPGCWKDPDGVCRWNYRECPPACVAQATQAACEKVAGCQWLLRGCSESKIPAAGCVDRSDLVCSIACVAPRRCALVTVDSCSLPGGAASDCADGACRDVAVPVCAWW